MKKSKIRKKNENKYDLKRKKREINAQNEANNIKKCTRKPAR